MEARGLVRWEEEEGKLLKASIDFNRVPGYVKDRCESIGWKKRNNKPREVKENGGGGTKNKKKKNCQEKDKVHILYNNNNKIKRRRNVQY